MYSRSLDLVTKKGRTYWPITKSQEWHPSSKGKESPSCRGEARPVDDDSLLRRVEKSTKSGVEESWWGGENRGALLSIALNCCGRAQGGLPATRGRDVLPTGGPGEYKLLNDVQDKGSRSGEGKRGPPGKCSTCENGPRGNKKGTFPPKKARRAVGD